MWMCCSLISIGVLFSVYELFSLDELLTVAVLFTGLYKCAVLGSCTVHLRLAVL